VARTTIFTALEAWKKLESEEKITLARNYFLLHASHSLRDYLDTAFTTKEERNLKIEDFVKFLEGYKPRNIGFVGFAGKLYRKNQEKVQEDFNKFLLSQREFKSTLFGYEPIDLKQLETLRSQASFMEQQTNTLKNALPNFEALFDKMIEKKTTTYNPLLPGFGTTTKTSIYVGPLFKSLIYNLERLSKYYIVVQKQCLHIREIIMKNDEMAKSMGIPERHRKKRQYKNVGGTNWEKDQKMIDAHTKQLGILGKKISEALVKNHTLFKRLKPVLKKTVSKNIKKHLIQKPEANKIKNFVKEELPYYLPIVGSLKYIEDDSTSPEGYVFLVAEVTAILLVFSGAVAAGGTAVLTSLGKFLAEDVAFLTFIKTFLDNWHNALKTYNPAWKTVFSVDEEPLLPILKKSRSIK